MIANSMKLPATNGAGVEPMPTAWNAESFVTECRRIVTEMQGHEAHRALDLLTNEVLCSLGFSDGIAIFEATVASWHKVDHQYPYSGPCSNCEPQEPSA